MCDVINKHITVFGISLKTTRNELMMRMRKPIKQQQRLELYLVYDVATFESSLLLLDIISKQY